MKENKYDNPDFFAKYSQMPRSLGGLQAAGEWPELRDMLPELRGKLVLDLGCGYGWHCRYAREQQAASVIGIDISEKMLQRAQELTDDDAIVYKRMAIEDIDFEEGQFDVIISSLALHYIETFDAVCKAAAKALKPGGSFVLSVEHPIFTSLATQDWHYSDRGEKLHWPVDRYHDEGPRRAIFLNEEVVKYHRTTASYLKALLDAGFAIKRLSELKPTSDMLREHPEFEDEVRRPIFLLLAAEKETGAV